jgi:ketosteroid isomerase-like protein
VAGPASLIPPAGFETPTTRHRRYFPNTDEAAELLRINAVDIAFSNAAQTDVAAAFGAYAAPDGAQTAGGSTTWAFGPEAIRAAWSGTASTFHWSPELGGVASSGDLGFTVGYVYFDGSPVPGKYFTVWQKQANGEWRYIVD